MADDFPYSMTGDDYRAALKRLAFADPRNPTDTGISAAGRFFGASPRTAHTWPVDGPPNSVAVCLYLMLLLGLDFNKAAGMLLAVMPKGVKGVKLPALKKRR